MAHFLYFVFALLENRRKGALASRCPGASPTLDKESGNKREKKGRLIWRGTEREGQMSRQELRDYSRDFPAR